MNKIEKSIQMTGSALQFRNVTDAPLVQNWFRDRCYRLFPYWTECGVFFVMFFVTRMKDNALCEVVEEHPVSQNRKIVSLISLTRVSLHSWE